MQCVYSRALPKATGPVTAMHLAILQQRQSRLTTAVRNMAAVIDKLNARGTGTAASEPAARDCSDKQVETFDLNEILEQYAPQDTHEVSDDDRTLPDSPGPRAKKRHLDVDGPRATTSHTPSAVPGIVMPADGSEAAWGYAPDIQQLNLHEAGSAPVSDDHSQNMPIQGASSVSSSNQIAAPESYEAFVALLRSMRDSAYMADASTLPQGDTTVSDGHNDQQLVALTGSRHVAAYEPLSDLVGPTAFSNTQMAPLIDMVDWDTSLQNCSDFFTGTQWPVTTSGTGTAPLSSFELDDLTFDTLDDFTNGECSHSSL